MKKVTGPPGGQVFKVTGPTGKLLAVGQRASTYFEHWSWLVLSPNGSRLRQKHPKGLLKVVSGWLSQSSWTAQYPDFALSLLKCVADVNLWVSSSTVGV